MRRRIIIKNAHIEKMGGGSRLVYDLQCEENQKCPQYSLYYQVDKKYEAFLTSEVSDACVVCLLLYAMQHDLDIVSNVPISERLYKQLTQYLIPAISSNIKMYNPVSITAEKTNPCFNGDAVGAGLSCGVDSFTRYSKI